MSEGMRRITTITLSTYRESMRSKVLYSVLGFAALIVGISALFGSVTIGDQVKVIKDFGLFAVSLFSVLYCVISGSTLLHKELSRKTVFNILSKAVYRSEFLTGKFLGMFATTAVLALLMGVGLSTFLYFMEGKVNGMLFLGYYHILLELLIVCSAVIFFSSIVVTPILIGLFSFGLFLAGRSLELLLELVAKDLVQGVAAKVIQALYWILPQLNAIHINDALVYEMPLNPQITIWATLYSVGYSVILLLLAQRLFKRREFN